MLTRKILLQVTFAVMLCPLMAQQSITSPDGNINTIINTSRQLSIAVFFQDQPLLLPSPINMVIGQKIALGNDLRIAKISRRTVNETIISPVPEKRITIRDEYNELTIRFRQPFSLICRVYNDGLAYRFVTRFKDTIIVQNEVANFTFPPGSSLYYPEVEKRADADSFHTSFESVYQYRPIDSIANNTLFFNPVMVVSPGDRPKMVITESDIEDYPGMFHRGNESNHLQAAFARYPLKETINESEYPQYLVTERAPYIAKTFGSRAFPWRVLAIGVRDADLPGNDIVYRLAAPSRVKDVSWIRPGKGTDEWIIGINLFNVPFKAGINTATYKYYIDFAKRFGFDRIMLDAGWSDYKDLFKINPNIDMDELSAYAAANGVKLSLWTLALTLHRQLDSALLQFKKWGVDYIMTDFMDRDDQRMVNFYYQMAEACARKQIMIMFHGAYKPAGFNRTFPNAITREGVLGAEWNIWSSKATPGHDLLLPFIRMVGGPMDYEPGLLDNATREQFRPISEKVMSMGTRCHQLAMFVVYDNPMQIFSGNPSQGWKEPAFMSLLGSIPSTWDETVIPHGEAGEFIITVRKKGDDWYIGGITNWKERALSLALDFLPPGSYDYTICRDGINANRYPADYIIEKGILTNRFTIPVTMAAGGGYLMVLKKK